MQDNGNKKKEPKPRPIFDNLIALKEKQDANYRKRISYKDFIKETVHGENLNVNEDKLQIDPVALSVKAMNKKSFQDDVSEKDIDDHQREQFMLMR